MPQEEKAIRAAGGAARKFPAADPRRGKLILSRADVLGSWAFPSELTVGPQCCVASDDNARGSQGHNGDCRRLEDRCSRHESHAEGDVSFSP